MTRGDWIVVLVVLLAAALAYPVAGIAASGDGGIATVRSPSGSSSLPLSEDRVSRVGGRAGGLTVEISGGAARVVSTDCPDKRCQRMGSASDPGDTIVCVPNGVTLTVGGERSDGLDAVSR